LKATVVGDGVWRIRRRERSSTIEVFKVEETGHGDILSDEFINWRIKLALNRQYPEKPVETGIVLPMSVNTDSVPG
jgi:RAT1-interacting protein